MRNWFDCYTKSFLQDMLGPTGKVETQHEITAADSQWADVWYEPNPALAHLRTRMGWLGAMSAAPCMFEPFGQPPDEEDVHECLRKLFTKKDQLIREAKKNKAPKPSLPQLWTIAPSLPPPIVKTFALRPLKRWPQGIFFGPKGYGLAWVSLRDLPRTRQTLLLRLMAGSGPVFRSALEDLENLPGDAWEKPHATEILVAIRAEFRQDPSGVEEAEQEFLMSTQSLVQQWKDELRQEGREEARREGLQWVQQWKDEARQEGRQEGLREGVQEGLREGRQEARQELAEALRTGLLETYRARFGTVPIAIRKAVRLARDPDKLAKWLPLFSTKSAEGIARILDAANKRRS